MGKKNSRKLGLLPPTALLTFQWWNSMEHTNSSIKTARMRSQEVWVFTSLFSQRGTLVMETAVKEHFPQKSGTLHTTCSSQRVWQDFLPTLSFSETLGQIVCLRKTSPLPTIWKLYLTTPIGEAHHPVQQKHGFIMLVVSTLTDKQPNP